MLNAWNGGPVAPEEHDVDTVQSAQRRDLPALIDAEGDRAQTLIRPSERPFVVDNLRNHATKRNTAAVRDVSGVRPGSVRVLSGFQGIDAVAHTGVVPDERRRLGRDRPDLRSQLVHERPQNVAIVGVLGPQTRARIDRCVSTRPCSLSKSRQSSNSRGVRCTG